MLTNARELCLQNGAVTCKVCTILPRTDSTHLNKQIIKINKKLCARLREHVVRTHRGFMRNHQINPNLFSVDGLHLSDLGQIKYSMVLRAALRHSNVQV